MKTMNICGYLYTFMEYFLKKNLPSDRHSHLGWERFTKLFLSNIVKYGKNDIEWQTSIQGMRLSDLGDSLRKRKGIVKYKAKDRMNIYYGVVVDYYVRCWEINTTVCWYVCHLKHVLKIEESICEKNNKKLKLDKFKIIYENL